MADNNLAHDLARSPPVQPHRDVCLSHFPHPTLTRLPSISDISVRSGDDIWAPDAAVALAGVHPPEIEMDPQPSGHRRRRSSLMKSLDGAGKKKKRRSSTSPVKGRGGIQEEPKLGERGTDEELSTSEDVELEDLSEEEEGLQDDEETGLTGKDKGRRKDRRRRNTLMDQRIAGEPQITAEEKKEADQNVLKRGFVNGVLIGLWYLFSLSISIVSLYFLAIGKANLDGPVQQMDVRPQTPRFQIPPLHHLLPHARPILSGVSSSLLPPAVPPSLRLLHESP